MTAEITVCEDCGHNHGTPWPSIECQACPEGYCEQAYATAQYEHLAAADIREEDK